MPDSPRGHGPASGLTEDAGKTKGVDPPTLSDTRSCYGARCGLGGDDGQPAGGGLRGAQCLRDLATARAFSESTGSARPGMEWGHTREQSVRGQKARVLYNHHTETLAPFTKDPRFFLRWGPTVSITPSPHTTPQGFIS